MPIDKSIFGSSFDDFVSQQLNIRSNILAGTNSANIPKGNLPKTGLPYTLSNDAFVRLSSSVNIDEDKALLFGRKDYQGSGLAKNYILQGGTLLYNKDKNKFGLRGGLSSYQVGGVGDFGLRPMPGIVSANVISRGRWGSLREATIQVKCFNREQLSIIETLYLKPGYTILLEWGNSTFYNNSNKIITNTRLIDFFVEGKTLDEIHKEILDKREQYSGNYDGFVGPIDNFNIKQQADGTYNCTVKAITWGTIIESLKANKTTNISQNSINKITVIDDLSTLIAPEKLDQSRLECILDVIKRTSNQGKYNNGKTWSVPIPDIFNEYFDTDKFGHSIFKNPTPVDSDKLTTFSVVPFTLSSDGSKSELNLNTYISLGSLLSIISKNCLLYTTNNTPIVNVNFNPSDNLCYSPELHISMDPNICLIRYDGPDYKPFGLSKGVNNINGVLPIFKKPNSKTIGYTMNIMLNIDFLIRQLQIVDGNREIHVYDFLTNIINEVKIALGNVNEFNVGYDSNTNTYTITDTQILDDSGELTIINTTGLKSSIRDISIDSKLSNSLATLIAIGAQASNQFNEGIDSSMFLRYNNGLTDRILPIKKNTTTEQFLGLEEYNNKLEVDKRAEFIKKFIANAYNKLLLVSNDINLCKNYYSEIIKTIKVKSNTSSAVIPFTFNLKMNGISGIRIGQLFSIEPNRLPKSYLDPKNQNQPVVAFLVTVHEHNIENNDWTVSIGGQAAPIRNLTIK